VLRLARRLALAGDWRSRRQILDWAGTKPTQRDDHSSRSRIAPGLKQPTRGSERRALANAMHTGRASPPLLFGLAPRGVFRAPSVATRAVGSYPTFSPLPKCVRPKEASPRFCRGPAAGRESHRRYIFCGTFRGRAHRVSPSRNARRNPLALPGALPFRRRLLRVRGDGSPDFPPAGPASTLRRIQASRRSSDSPAEIIIKHVRQIDRGNTFGVRTRPLSEETAEPKRDPSASVGMTKMPTPRESARRGYHATPMGFLYR